MKTATLEPASTALPAFHVDLHIDEDCLIRRQLYSADEVRIDVGAASIYLSRAALAKLLREGHLAEDDLELLSQLPDPLPVI